MEKEDEVKGSGNSYDFGARIYDARVGRFLSLDAFASKFASQSPFCFAGNTPLMALDVNGDSVLFYSVHGEYLGFSTDNQRYHNKNLLVIIEDKNIQAFNHEYNLKKYNNEYPSPEAREANVAGLEAMGTSFDVTDMERFYTQHKHKLWKNEKMVDRGKDVLEVEWSAKMYIDKSNPLDKGGSVAVDETSRCSLNSIEDSPMQAHSHLVGDFHTHPEHCNSGPSDNPDKPRARSRINGSWNVIMTEGRVTLYRAVVGKTKVGNEYVETQVVPVDLKNFSSQPKKP
jgi:RHS repeat-associated protein